MGCGHHSCFAIEGWQEGAKAAMSLTTALALLWQDARELPHPLGNSYPTELQKFMHLCLRAIEISCQFHA